MTIFERETGRRLDVMPGFTIEIQPCIDGKPYLSASKSEEDFPKVLRIMPIAQDKIFHFWEIGGKLTVLPAISAHLQVEAGDQRVLSQAVEYLTALFGPMKDAAFYRVP